MMNKNQAKVLSDMLLYWAAYRVDSYYDYQMNAPKSHLKVQKAAQKLNNLLKE